MNIDFIKEISDRIDEVAAIGASAEYEGFVCHAAGFIRKERTMGLILLRFRSDDAARHHGTSAGSRNFDEPLNTETITSIENESPNGIPGTAYTTNREELKCCMNLQFDGPLGSISQITIEDTVYQVQSSSMGYLHLQDFENMYILWELLRNGWNPAKAALPELEQLCVISIEFAGEYTSLPQFEAEPRITLKLSPSMQQFLIEQPVTLLIGDGPSEKLFVTNAEHVPLPWYCISQIMLFDPWENLNQLYSAPRILEHLTPEEANKQRQEQEQQLTEQCPRGMCFPVVEYECPEDIFLQFYPKDFLDAQPVHQNSASVYFPVPQKTKGRHGLRLKQSVIPTPVPSDTVKLELELFSCHQMKEAGEVTIG